TYSWSPSIGNTASVNNLAPGTYDVTVTPSGGCPVSSSATITEPPLLSVVATSSPGVVCEGGQVTLNAVANGGTPNYSFEWIPGGLSGSTQILSPTSSAGYTVEVTDQNGCTATATTSFAFSPQLLVEIDSDISSGCEPLCVDFTDLTIAPQPIAISSWLWDFGDGGFSQEQNPAHCFQDGVFAINLTVTTSDGCTSTSASPLLMDAWPAPQADFTFTPSKPDVENPEVRFINLSTGSNQWLWNFGDVGNSFSNIENPFFIYADTGTYVVSLVATSDLGCTDTSSQSLIVLPMLTFYMPNSFTPNGDGINDFFMPITMVIQPEGYLMNIFNRWGQLVFSANNPRKGWDGVDIKSSREEPMGAYSWHIQFKDKDSKIVTRTGTVLLVR
ncbi:MAG: PKD domain-containing protein, partial [Bacteroidota bacterium]